MNTQTTKHVAVSTTTRKPPRASKGFAAWLDLFIEEKGIDVEHTFEVEGASGTNWIPVGCLIEALKAAPASEQDAVQRKIVQIDFRNGDVLDFFKYPARAIAR